MTSRLVFYREPSWMAQFPFAHTIEMTYRLAAGVLEVNLRLHNLGSEPMPVSIGFHPYYRLTDSPREDWTIGIGARKQWLLNSDKIPTGETVPIKQLFPDPNRIALKDYDLDHVFSDLVRDRDGRALMRVKGKSQQLEVLDPNTTRSWFFLRSLARRPRVVRLGRLQARTLSASSQWPALQTR